MKAIVHGQIRCFIMIHRLPSGNYTKNYGKSPRVMAKSAINGHFQ